MRGADRKNAYCILSERVRSAGVFEFRNPNIPEIANNRQPVAAEVNNYKTNKHPHSFFNSQEGQKYYQDYDLMPEINSPIWDDADNFIEWRKSKMIETMKTKYAIILEDFQP